MKWVFLLVPLLVSSVLAVCSAPLPPAYVHSNQGDPWGASAANDLNNAFGTNNWQEFFVETANINTILDPCRMVVFFLGSDDISVDVSTFYTANANAIQNWVAAGGYLWYNDAPNEGSGFALGFNGFSFYGTGFDTFSPTCTVEPTQAGDRAFTYPNTVTTTTFTGNACAHGGITLGANGVALMSGSAAPVIMAKVAWGSGQAMFSCFTDTQFWGQQVDANNLDVNILLYDCTCASTTYTVSSTPGYCYGTIDYNANPPVDCAPVSGSPLLAPVGTSPLSITMGDLSCTVNYQVVDVEDPVINCPTGFFREYATPPTCSATLNYGLWATDNCPGQTPQTFSASPNTPINDNTVITSNINVGAAARVEYLMVQADLGGHTFVGDLDLSLSSPSGQQIQLFDQHCGSTDWPQPNGLIFDDSAINSVDACGSYVSGASIQPFQALSAFRGTQMNGQWQLTITDNIGGDQGTLEYWSLIFYTLNKVSVPSDQTPVPVGEYDVVATVTDVAGRTDSCSFFAEVLYQNQCPSGSTNIALPNLPTLSTTVSGSTPSAQSLCSTPCAAFNGQAIAVYSFVGPSNGVFGVDISMSGFSGSGFTVFRCQVSLQQLCETGFTASGNLVTVQTIPGALYYVVVGSQSGASGSFSLTLTLNLCALPNFS